MRPQKKTMAINNDINLFVLMITPSFFIRPEAGPTCLNHDTHYPVVTSSLSFDQESLQFRQG